MDPPLRFFSLGLDSAEVSGWAFAHSPSPAQCTEFGSVKTARDRRDIVVRAKREAFRLELPLVIVIESWPGLWRSWVVCHGAGKNFGRWLELIELELHVKESGIVRVNPRVWRPDVLGKENLAGTDKHGAKRLACAFAGTKDHNAAEAKCLTIWAQTSFEGQEAAAAGLRRSELVTSP